MRKFILHITIFIIAVISTILITFSSAGGNSDPYYLKLSSPKKSNLILGTSKAAQGIQPESLKKILNKEFYNYSFAVFASPYGEVYLKSIKNKLDTVSLDNSFILSIDAWSITSNTADPNDSLNFREKSSFLHGITNVNRNPNYKYLFNYFESSYYTLAVNTSPAILHDDGWLEVSLSNDSISVQNRTAFTIKDYIESIQDYNFSSVRLKSLIETIDYLKKFGSVYLVRLPVHPRLSEIESELLPGFDSIIQPAIEKSDGYLDLMIYNQSFNYTDGVHLDKTGGTQVSNIIAKWIKNINN